MTDPKIVDPVATYRYKARLDNFGSEAKLAYNAFCETVVKLTKTEPPSWEALSEDDKSAWCEAVKAVMNRRDDHTHWGAGW